MKTNSEIKLSTLFFGLGIIVFVFTLSPASALDTGTPECRTITGVSRGIPYEGGGGASVENSGRVDFEVIEGIDGGHDLRACTEVSGSFTEISGYAWNTNLGYMSFRCEDEGGGSLTNRGISCGTVAYGSSVYTFPVSHPTYGGERVLVGYSWGENIGWVSLACLDFDGDPTTSPTNYLSGDPTSSPVDGGCSTSGVEYGTFIDENGDIMDFYPLGVSAVSSYAYAQSVGWLSLGAATSPPPGSPPGPDVPPPGPHFDLPPGIEVTYDSPPVPPGGDPERPGGGGPRGGLVPRHPAGDALTDNTSRAYANGEDEIELRFRILNGGTDITCDDSELHQITVSMINDVRFNQVDSTVANLAGTSPVSMVTVTDSGSMPLLDSTINYRTAADSPTFNPYFSCYPESGANYFSIRFRSIAPTSSDTQNLEIESISVNYGSEVVLVDPPLAYESADPRGFLYFYPAVEITKLSSMNVRNEFDETALHAFRNTPNPFRIEAARHISGGTIGANNEITLSAPFTDSSSEDLFDYFYDEDCDGPTLPGDLEEGEEPTRSQLRDPLPDGSPPLNAEEVNLPLSSLINEGSGMEESYFNPPTENENPCVFAYFTQAGDNTTTAQQIGSAGLGNNPTPGVYQFYVSYTVGTQEVRYYTLGLPPGQTVNQFAKAEGLIKVNPEAFRELVEESGFGRAVSKPVGEELVAGRGIRENILRTVAKFSRRPLSLAGISGVTINPDEDEIVIEETALANINSASDAIGNIPKKNMFYFSRRTTGVPPVSTPARPFRVVLQATDGVINPLSEPVTLVCEGCNFFVDSNIENPAFIGLITIDDRSLDASFSVNTLRKQGNLYICGAVTETNLVTFLDGSIFHYGRNDGSGNVDCSKQLYTNDPMLSDSGVVVVRYGDLVSPFDLTNPSLPVSNTNLPRCALINMETGLPSFEGCSSSVISCDILDNQWTNYGQVMSRNSLGASTFLPPITAEGDIANTPDLALRARRQDFNFMRCAKWVDNEFYGVTGIQYCWDSSIQSSPSLGSTVCTEESPPQNFPPQHAIVNLRVRQYREFPIFGELSRF